MVHGNAPEDAGLIAERTGNGQGADSIDLPALSVVRLTSLQDCQSHGLATQTARRHRDQQIKTLLSSGSEMFTVSGYCYVCKEQVDFTVDFAYGTVIDGLRVPNWRERLVCPVCNLNNRMRASIQFFEQVLKPQRDAAIYVTEQTTPMFKWIAKTYRNAVGSEYLGETIPFGGRNAEGIRNESVTRLTFADGQFDFMLSFEVFEHIPEFLQAFKECHRLLKEGGRILFTVPFVKNSARNVTRAVVRFDGQIEHILPPEYHGDPLKQEGCLAFRHFGWEMLDHLRDAGFNDVAAYSVWSDVLGNIGEEMLMFVAAREGANENGSAKVNSAATRNPLVSIIIPIENGTVGVQKCVRSILEETREVECEIIVAGNPLPCGVQENEAGVEVANVRWLDTGMTTGAGRICNVAIKQSKGEILVFLGSSTVVERGWLENLLRSFNSDQRPAAVTCKVVDSDNRIVEAGCSVPDGSGVKRMGESSSKNDPACSFVRSVDAGSMYCMLISKRVLNDVGGFDEKISSFGPGLVDIGMRVRANGNAILYQPTSRVELREPCRDESASLAPSRQRLENLRPEVTLPIRESGAGSVMETKSVLILGIYLANKLNNIQDIVANLSRAGTCKVAQRWVALGGEPPSGVVAEVTSSVLYDRKPKYEILNEMLASVDRDAFDYIVTMDDDIVLPEGFLDRFIAQQAQQNFVIAQPARTKNSYIDHPIVCQQDGVISRRTLFVEIGPVTSFHRTAFNIVFPFDLTSAMGWGYENVWAYQLNQRGLAMGIVDCTPVDHSLRKPVENYAWGDADREREEFLKTHDHLPLEECFRVLDVMSMEGVHS